MHNYKTAKRTNTSDGMLDIEIDDDDFSDDYDFADSDDEAAETRRIARQQARKPVVKYLDLLQKVSNRLEDEITIELDDLAQVRRMSNTMKSYS